MNRDVVVLQPVGEVVPLLAVEDGEVDLVEVVPARSRCHRAIPSEVRTVDWRWAVLARGVAGFQVERTGGVVGWQSGEAHGKWQDGGRVHALFPEAGDSPMQARGMTATETLMEPPVVPKS